MSTTSELDVISSRKDGTNKSGFDGGRGHARNHDGRLAEKAGEGGIDVNSADTAQRAIVRHEIKKIHTSAFLPCPDQLRPPLLAPPFLILHILRIIKLSVTLTFVTNNDDSNTSSIEVTNAL